MTQDTTVMAFQSVVKFAVMEKAPGRALVRARSRVQFQVVCCET